MPEEFQQDWREDRYGFLRWLVLPREGWREWWDRIYVDPDVKRRLRSYAGFCLRHRSRFSSVGLPVHGMALLHGPPGTGKSSLARGLAEVVAEDLANSGFTDQTIFAEVDPHALPSQMLGESQRNTINLLEKSLPELAEKGHPVVVLIDEINSLAPSRSLAAGGRDPVDVLRATEAVLRGVDYLASVAANLLVVATSNFTLSLDEAMLDRLDLAVEIGLPTPDGIALILRDALDELPDASVDDEDLSEMASALRGHSGRDVRKVVLEALVTRDIDEISSPLTGKDIWRIVDTKRREKP